MLIWNYGVSRSPGAARVDGARRHSKVSYVYVTTVLFPSHPAPTAMHSDDSFLLIAVPPLPHPNSPMQPKIVSCFERLRASSSRHLFVREGVDRRDVRDPGACNNLPMYPKDRNQTKCPSLGAQSRALSARSEYSARGRPSARANAQRHTLEEHAFWSHAQPACAWRSVGANERRGLPTLSRAAISAFCAHTTSTCGV